MRLFVQDHYLIGFLDFHLFASEQIRHAFIFMRSTRWNFCPAGALCDAGLVYVCSNFQRSSRNVKIRERCKAKGILWYTATVAET